MREGRQRKAETGKQRQESNERESDGCVTTANGPAGPTLVEENQDDFDSALNNALMLNPELFP